MASDQSSTESRDWQSGKSVTQSLLYMLENEIDCDVTFEFPSGERKSSFVSAHKLLLRGRSPVFEAMFNGNFAETKENPQIIDLDIEIFREMLRYMYTDNVALNGDNVLHLLYAANKYILGGLVSKCEDFLETSISPDNVCSVLTNTIVLRDDSLAEKCLDIIVPNVPDVLKSQSFMNMSYDALLKIVRCDKIPQVNESSLFEKCVDWAKMKTPNSGHAPDEEIRTCLGECLRQIRFLEFPTVQEFAKLTENANVLTADEKCHIMYWFTTQSSIHSDTLREMGFNTSSRIVKYPRYQTPSTQYNCRVNCSSGSEQQFRLIPQQEIVLAGFSLNVGSASPNLIYDVNVTVMNESSNSIIATIQRKVTSDGNPIPVFTENICLQGNISHKFVVKVTGPDFISVPHTMIGSLRMYSFSCSDTVLCWPTQTYNAYHSGYNTGVIAYASYIPELCFKVVR